MLAATAAEAGGRWSSIRSSLMNRVRKGKESGKKGLQKVKRGVREVPQLARRCVSLVQNVWECALCMGKCLCGKFVRLVGSLLGSSPAPEPAAEPTPVTLAETGAGGG